MDKLKVGKLLHGGDYNPEQWLHMPEILEQDISYLKKAKCNAVSLGIFSWSALEPKEGCFHFEWLEKIVDNLHNNGISIILATPSGARPKWLSDKYPEVLRVDEAGRRNFFGERHNHCYTSPVYREKVKIINTQLAKRFANHPGVILWHISNEYGGECWCSLCQEKFREWLKDKYKTIDNLNQSWCTAFWSHAYNSFDQIEAPSKRGESGLHGLVLDWKRFVTDRTVDFMKHEVCAVRPFNESLPVTANMMYYFEGLNYHRFKDTVDIVSWDSYPSWHKWDEAWTAMDTGMCHDIMRSIKKQPFLLMESCPSATNWQAVSKLKKPDMHELSSLQAVAHGSDSVLYFQWRQSRGSFEKFHGAVVDHYGGCDTRVFQDVTQTGGALEALKELAGSDTKARAAVIYDWENKWAMEAAKGPRNEGLYYKETVEKLYQGFRRLGLNVDVIDMEASLDGYEAVAAPMLYMYRADFPKKAKAFTEQGGILIGTYWSGIVDENDLCYLNGTPHGLMDVFGLRSQEIDGLYDNETNHACLADSSLLPVKQSYECRHLCELCQLKGAEPLMVYKEDFYAGKAVFTRHGYGRGAAYYVGADMEPAFYEDALAALLKKEGIALPFTDTIPAGIEITERCKNGITYRFIQNFTKNAADISRFVQDGALLYGDSSTTLKPFGTVVVKLT